MANEARQTVTTFLGSFSHSSHRAVILDLHQVHCNCGHVRHDDAPQRVRDADIRAAEHELAVLLSESADLNLRAVSEREEERPHGILAAVASKLMMTASVYLWDTPFNAAHGAAQQAAASPGRLAGSRPCGAVPDYLRYPLRRLAAPGQVAPAPRPSLPRTVVEVCSCRLLSAGGRSTRPANRRCKRLPGSRTCSACSADDASAREQSPRATGDARTKTRVHMEC